jgi:DNA repair photolyase
MEPAIREVFCKSALTKSGITDYAINPYVGCAHNCVYCYASFMARFSRHDRPWGQWVDVKVNAPLALAEDLRRAAERQPTPNASFEIVMSSVTDPYQPPERKYGVTRACLEVLAGGPPGSRAGLFPTPDDRVPAHPNLSVLTKSDLVLRDIDVLQSIPSVEVGLSITSTDDAVSRLYEPGASPATKRLAALKALSDAGIKTWAFVSPVLPYHSDSEQAMLGILRAIQDAGALRVMVDRFNPYPASVNRFLRVAPPEAAGALREYTRSQADYLDRLRDTAWTCASTLGMAVRVLF